MKPIRQTWFGRVLCALGIHSLVWGQSDRDPDAPWVFSLYGGCVRCDRSFQWDA